ncbi:MAG: hypothetical protein HN567_07080 [Actinobacteria bacterium]|nr:hypothetical protein [Actinomycetota bacterium]MBT3746052.1 hypothetical protein [Actinomycetota bacterium]MBT3970153.1 hypothetical protein [Actinomycetota bacterium]MBT4009772.1 hypothetical protein [Actinomycetota bacterium]MBT4304102.1 hypothetical protein [Actinomycetota bacterium]
MHDINDFERRGIPGVFVASAPFVDAAETQAKALGLEVARVFTAHPIQDRTDHEMRSLAETAFAQLVEKITAP